MKNLFSAVLFITMTAISISSFADMKSDKQSVDDCYKELKRMEEENRKIMESGVNGAKLNDWNRLNHRCGKLKEKYQTTYDQYSRYKFEQSLKTKSKLKSGDSSDSN